MPNHLHNIHRIFRIRNELQEVYLNLVIQTFSVALVGIFIPIYLLELGFALDIVIIFMILFFLSIIIFSPFAGKMSSGLGLKHTILFSVPLMVCVLLLFMAMPTLSPIFVLLVAVLYGLRQSMYWVPLHAEFVRNTDSMHEGKEVGNMIALPKIATIIAPIMGAFILQWLGFPLLFILVIVLLILSLGPLFASGDYKRHFRFDLKKMEFGLNRSLYLAHSVEGVFYVAEFVMWPVFIYLTFGDLLSVGLAATLSGLGIAVFTFLMGRASKRFSHRRLLGIGAIGYSATWFSRLFVTTPMGAFLVSFMGGMFAAVISIVIYVTFCGFARKRNEVNSSVSRELWLGIGRVIPLVLLLFVLSKFGLIFILAGICSLLLLLVKPK